MFVNRVPLDSSPESSEGSELREAAGRVVAKFDGRYAQLVVEPGILNHDGDLDVVECRSRRTLAVPGGLETFD